MSSNKDSTRKLILHHYRNMHNICAAIITGKWRTEVEMARKKKGKQKQMSKGDAQHSASIVSGSHIYYTI